MSFYKSSTIVGYRQLKEKWQKIIFDIDECEVGRITVTPEMFKKS